MFEIIIVIIIATALYALYIGPPYMPTFKKELDELYKLAEISKDKKIVDLGSGDGRLLIYFAQKGNRATGYEINPVLYLYSKIKIRKNNAKGNAKVYLKNFWKEDLEKFNVVFVFGIGHIMDKLEEKLKKELRPGSYVISNSFQFEELELIKKHKVFFLYKI